MASAAEGWRKSSYSFIDGHCLEWAFRKPSHSHANGNCLEAAFRKSSRSTCNGNCAEVALLDGVVLVRDSKQAPAPGCEGPAGPHLAFSPAAWAAFTAALKT